MLSLTFLKQVWSFQCYFGRFSMTMGIRLLSTQSYGKDIQISTTSILCFLFLQAFMKSIGQVKAANFCLRFYERKNWISKSPNFALNQQRFEKSCQTEAEQKVVEIIRNCLISSLSIKWQGERNKKDKKDWKTLRNQMNSVVLWDPSQLAWCFS